MEQFQVENRIRHDILALYLATNLGLSTFYNLVNWFGSATAVRQASRAHLETVPGLSPERADKIYKFLHTSSEAEEVARLAPEQIELLTFIDERYPARLKQIYQPPPVLYCRGTFAARDRNAIALVGTRRTSSYGLSVAAKLGYELAERGLTIVSGLARGIDQAAHRAALDAGGRTIAVLGSGLQQVYPAQSEKLVAEIVEHGVLISEFPLEQPPYKGNFPRRNRIISGLCLGVVVVEAPQRSGALITAHYALEQGREVCAVPGRITSFSAQGCNRLIQMGAKLVTEVEDIIAEIEFLLDKTVLPARSSSVKVPPRLEPSAQRVYDLCSDEPLHIDQIQRQCGLSPNQLALVLLHLEMEGLLKQLPGKMYQKNLLLV